METPVLLNHGSQSNLQFEDSIKTPACPKNSIFTLGFILCFLY